MASVSFQGQEKQEVFYKVGSPHSLQAVLFAPWAWAIFFHKGGIYAKLYNLRDLRYLSGYSSI
jgi:hypothetical protein